MIENILSELRMLALVIAEHPADEVLGTTGTIACPSDFDDQVLVIIFEECSALGQQDQNRILVRDVVSDMVKSAQMICSTLCSGILKSLNLLNHCLYIFDRCNLVKRIVEGIACDQQECVFVYQVGDLNSNHRLPHEAPVKSCNPLARHVAKWLLSYDVLSSSELRCRGLHRPFILIGL